MKQRKLYYKCKKCGIPYQKPIRCKVCHKLCCKNCLVNDKTCIDCYVKANEVTEHNLYTNDKIMEIYT